MSDAAARFDVRLAEARSLVEAALGRRLATLESEGTPPRLAAAMRDALLGGGKRFRPFLVLEVGRLLGAADAALVEIAAALECVHCYSLVHDDLPAMDNDELRRGRPTVWKAFDEWTAILAGDALLTLAFEIIAGIEQVAPSIRVELSRRLAQGAGHLGMVGGQALDLAADKLGEPRSPSIAHIRRLQSMKTGALIAFAAEAGAVAAGAAQDDIARVGAYGRSLGRAFQISDDLLDAVGTADSAGKAVGKDAAAGKATLVSLLGLNTARIELAGEVTSAIDALGPYGPHADALRGAARAMIGRDR